MGANRSCFDIELCGEQFSAERQTEPLGHARCGAGRRGPLAQATALGLHVHQMGGFHVDKAREVFSIPDGVEPAAAIALGYRGDPALLPGEKSEIDPDARERLGLDEIVFHGDWGNRGRFFVSHWMSIALRTDVVRRSLKVGLLVGTILVAINHGNLLLSGVVTSEMIWKSLLTYCVPYCVSTYASVSAILERSDPMT